MPGDSVPGGLEMPGDSMLVYRGVSSYVASLFVGVLRFRAPIDHTCHVYVYAMCPGEASIQARDLQAATP